MATGANTTPLGRIHPVLQGRYSSGNSSSNNLGSKSALNNPDLQAHLEAAKRAASALFPTSEEPPTKKKKRSRWGGEESRTVIPGMPTVIPPNMSEIQQKLYLIHLQVEDLSRRLRIDDLGIPANPTDRSPSPEPLYSHDGKRLNTREVRVRKKMEDDRHELIQEALRINPMYQPPADYRAPTKKFEDKVFIPQDEHPLTNFVGLIIGPRGNTLKTLEKETNCKIMIRGKGATKEGKFNRMGIPQPGEDEPLHALISATSPEDLKIGVDRIKAIVQSGIDNPGNENDLKRQQMMQLAELNGTYRPLDLLTCRNCGSAAHRTWECPEGQNITSTIICTRCGGGGHIASDCKVDLSGNSGPLTVTDRAKMDSEYQSLMKELGETVPETAGGTQVPPPASLMAGSFPAGMSPAEAWAAGIPLVPFPPLMIPPLPMGPPWLPVPIPGMMPIPQNQTPDVVSAPVPVPVPHPSQALPPPAPPLPSDSTPVPPQTMGWAGPLPPPPSNVPPPSVNAPPPPPPPDQAPPPPPPSDPPPPPPPS